MTDIGRAYDQVTYRGDPHVHSHPDRLATLGSLYGMRPAPATRCRVLELGCGTGGNLAPMAYQYPDSTFIGIDLSEQSVQQACRDAAGLGLKNLEFRRYDILDVTPEFGQFDYIVAHGVYSWVPAVVRSKILAIFKQNLAPQGVAYVSYNSSPGSYLRDLARDIMRFHVRGISVSAESIRQARAVLQFVAQSSSEKNVHGLVLRDQLERVRKKTDETLFHDDLAEESASFRLQQVTDEAARHGLQYLSDASFSRSYLGNYPPSLIKVLEAIPDEEFVRREQYLDYVVGHAFRRTLLCHAEVSLDRRIDPRSIRNYQLASALAP
ncbi:MAG TPA: class I SAM-dependent methyltransferase, partial [Bradyrhizobium sp.]|nr:class I SAM-dependent methyltransferase [Bradyrhizobium sp.]